MWFHPILKNRILPDDVLVDLKRNINFLFTCQKTISNKKNNRLAGPNYEKDDIQIFDSNDLEVNQLFIENYDRWWYWADSYLLANIDSDDYILYDKIEDYQLNLNSLLLYLNICLEKIKDKISDNFKLMYKLKSQEIIKESLDVPKIRQLEICESISNPYNIFYKKFKYYHDIVSILHDNIMFEDDLYKKADLISDWFDNWILDVLVFLKKWEDNIVINWYSISTYSKIVDNDLREKIELDTNNVENILSWLWVRKI